MSHRCAWMNRFCASGESPPNMSSGSGSHGPGWPEVLPAPASVASQLGLYRTVMAMRGESVKLGAALWKVRQSKKKTEPAGPVMWTAASCGEACSSSDQESSGAVSAWCDAGRIHVPPLSACPHDYC